MRKCPRCGRMHERNAMSNGRPAPYCQECHNAAMRESRARRSSIPISAEERIRQRARGLVRRRIARGKLVRGRCSVCGTPNADAHHADYSKPLEITWLCRVCHRRAPHTPVVT